MKLCLYPLTCQIHNGTDGGSVPAINRCMIYKCLRCNITFNSRDKRKFCSRTCSTTFNNSNRNVSDLQKEKTSQSLERYYMENAHHGKINTTVTKVCPHCGDSFTKRNVKGVITKYCSPQCATSSDEHKLHCRKAGQKSARTRVIRSKDERHLFDLCASHFQSVDHNQPLVDNWDADIVIHDIKTAILWNGPWHRIQMPHKNHSLSQVQTRDRIKVRELTNAGWNVIVFEDDQWTPQDAFDFLVGDARLELAPDSYELSALTHELIPQKFS